MTSLWSSPTEQVTSGEVNKTQQVSVCGDLFLEQYTNIQEPQENEGSDHRSTSEWLKVLE